MTTMPLTPQDVRTMSDADLQRTEAYLRQQVHLVRQARRADLAQTFTQQTRELARGAQQHGYRSSYVEEALAARESLPPDFHPWLPRPRTEAVGLYVLRLNWITAPRTDPNVEPPLPRLYDLMTPRERSAGMPRVEDAEITMTLHRYYNTYSPGATGRPPEPGFDAYYDLTSE